MSAAITDVRMYYTGYEDCEATITVQRTRDPGLGLYSCPLPEDLRQRLREWLEAWSPDPEEFRHAKCEPSL